MAARLHARWPPGGKPDAFRPQDLCGRPPAKPVRRYFWGWLVSRFTARSITISGLAIIVVSCLGLAALGITASLIVAAEWLSLLAVGWGLAQTPQSDVMMSYASPEL